MKKSELRQLIKEELLKEEVDETKAIENVVSALDSAMKYLRYVKASDNDYKNLREALRRVYRFVKDRKFDLKKQQK